MMRVQRLFNRIVCHGVGWVTAALVLGCTGCAPGTPPPGSMSWTSASTPAPGLVAPGSLTPDTPALEGDPRPAGNVRQDAHDRLWSTVSLRPEVVAASPTFAELGPNAGRLLSDIGCQFVVSNGDAVEHQFRALRVTVQVTTRIRGYPVTNTFFLDSRGFRVPAGGSTLIGSAQLPSDGAGVFEYQFGGGWENESWGRVYRGPLAEQDTFVSLDVPSVNLQVMDSTPGPSDKAFPMTGCQLRA